MKTWLDALPVNARVAVMADLVTLTLRDGSTTYRWTTLTAPVVFGGNTYFPAGSNGPGMVRDEFENEVGLTVDTFNITLLGGSYFINSTPLPLLAVNGYFDGATIQIDHLLGPDLASALGWGPISKFFFGYVGDCEPQGPDLLLHCNTVTIKFQQQRPLVVIQPQCNYAVYDANCGLNPASFTLSGTAAAGSTTTVVQTATSGIVAQPADYYDLGVVTFTSGALNGQSFDVLKSLAGALTVCTPLPIAPVAGDTFTVFPGCDLSRLRCSSIFNNIGNWRAFVRVPTTESGS